MLTAFGIILLATGIWPLVFGAIKLYIGISSEDEDYKSRGAVICVDGAFLVILGLCLFIVGSRAPLNEPRTYEINLNTDTLYVCDEKATIKSYKIDTITDAVYVNSDDGPYIFATVVIDGQTLTLTEFKDYLENNGYHLKESEETHETD